MLVYQRVGVVTVKQWWVKTIIHHPFGNGLSTYFRWYWRIVYCGFTHINGTIHNCLLWELQAIHWKVYQHIITYHHMEILPPEIHIPFSWKYMFIPFWIMKKVVGNQGKYLGKLCDKRGSIQEIGDFIAFWMVDVLLEDHPTFTFHHITTNSIRDFMFIKKQQGLCNNSSSLWLYIEQIAMLAN